MSKSFLPFFLFGLQCLFWVIGRLSSKHLSNKKDYFLAGKTVSLFPLMMTFFATQVGGGTILGAADEAYRYGWFVLFYPLGASLGLILLGCGVGKKMASFPISTTAQIFEIAYGSSSLKKVASSLSILSLFMILLAQIIASKEFLTSLGIQSSLFFIVFWAIVIFYTAQGGLKAVISTDVVQALFFSVIFFLCLGWATFSHPASLSISLSQLNHTPFLSKKLLGWLFMPLLFMLIEQDMGQRCFSGANAKVISRASFLAGICTMIICTIPIFFGSLAKSQGYPIPKGESVLINAISQTTTPLLTAFAGCAILAATISTATSLINAISSNISNDFTLSFLKSKPVSSAKAITCFISILAIYASFYFVGIVDVLMQSYELSVSCLFVPTLFALFTKKNLPSFVAWLAILFGACSFFLFRIYPISYPKEIIHVLFSLLGYTLGKSIYRFSLMSR